MHFKFFRIDFNILLILSLMTNKISDRHSFYTYMRGMTMSSLKNYFLMGPQRKDMARRQLSASQREAAILGNTQSQCAGHLLLTWPSQYIIDVTDQCYVLWISSLSGFLWSKTVNVYCHFHGNVNCFWSYSDWKRKKCLYPNQWLNTICLRL